MTAEQHASPAQRAPRIFLDLRDIIEITRLRRGRSNPTESRRQAYQDISDAVTRGLCTVVFNPAVYAELVDGLHSDQPWDDVADFFRTAPSVIEVESLVAYTIELLEEVRSLLPDLQLPRAAILREPGEWSPEMVELLRHHPDWQGRGVIVPHKRPKDVAIRDWRDSILRVARGEPETLPSRITGWRESVAVTRPYFRTVAKDAIAPEAIIHWMKHANSRGGNEPIRQGPDDRGLDGGDRKGSKQ